MTDTADSSDHRDPVCGKPVDPLRARAVGIFGGVTQYFCSPECKAKYADPRALASTGGPGGPGGIERRIDPPQDQARGEGTGEWFTRNSGTAAPPPEVDRFTDLEESAPKVSTPPTPSLIIAVQASRRRTWIWVALGVLAGVGLLVLGLR